MMKVYAVPLILLVEAETHEQAAALAASFAASEQWDGNAQGWQELLCHRVKVQAAGPVEAEIQLPLTSYQREELVAGMAPVTIEEPA
jgi:hypothetical protein